MIWFSHTKSGRPLVDDIYRARSDGAQRINITNSPGTWEEHGEPSPNVSLVTFNSSRSFDWKHPPDTARTLKFKPPWRPPSHDHWLKKLALSQQVIAAIS